MLYDSITQLQAQAAAGATQGTLLAQVARKTAKMTRGNKPYWEVSLADASASFVLKVWDSVPWYADFQALEEGAAVAVSAEWRMNQYGLDPFQVEVRPATPEEEEILWSGGEGLAACQQEAWKSICSMADSVQDPRLSLLCRAFLENFEARFRRAGAARNFHHARRGGLAEHTAGVMRTAAALCVAYPRLNRDLLLAGALFHDCGKMWENAYPEHGLAMPYSDVGELLGHIPLGIELVNKLWQCICTPARKEEWKGLQPETEQVRRHLLHLIAAHHGSLEFGSPVPPKTPEALALNHADDMDAKMEMFRAAYESSPALAPHIMQRKAPLPSNVVVPLPAYADKA